MQKQQLSKSDVLLEQIKSVIQRRAWKNGRLINFVTKSIDTKILAVDLIDQWYVNKQQEIK